MGETLLDMRKNFIILLILPYLSVINLNAQDREYKSIEFQEFISGWDKSTLKNKMNFKELDSNAILAYAATYSMFMKGGKFYLIKKNEQYKIVLTDLIISPLKTFQLRNSFPHIIRRNITEKFATKLQELFLLGFKENSNKTGLGFDGSVHYYFVRYENNQSTAALSRFPSKKSFSIRIQKICEKIVRKANKRKFPEKKLIKEIDALLKQ